MTRPSEGRMEGEVKMSYKTWIDSLVKKLSGFYIAWVIVMSLACLNIGFAQAGDVDKLIKQLKDEDKEVRIWAVIALGEIGDAGATEPLIAALKDKDESVREGAATALGEIGDPRAVDYLSPIALKDESWNVQRTAIKALDKIGGSRAVEPLIAVLKDAAPKHQFRDYRARLAILALGNIGDSRAVDPLVAAMRGHWDDVQPQLEARDALVKIKDLGATWSLIEALKDDDQYVRALAADALKKITGQDFKEDYNKWIEWRQKQK